MLMDMGCQGPRLACGRALAVAGDEWAGGHCVEQDGRATVAREMELY